jgi:hypothetical protein
VASGFTHLGGPAVTLEVAEPKGVVRLRPTDVFTARAASSLAPGLAHDEAS